MGAMSRTKGKAGERELARLVSDLTGWEVKRRVRQHEGDSDLDGVPGWSIEVKRHKVAPRADIRAWWVQAVAQAIAEKACPLLFYRADRGDWRAVWPVARLLIEQQAEMWTGYEWTADTSVDAWAAVARDGAMAPPRDERDDQASRVANGVCDG